LDQLLVSPDPIYLLLEYWLNSNQYTLTIILAHCHPNYVELSQQVWYFISKNQLGLQTFRSTQKLSSKPFLVS